MSNAKYYRALGIKPGDPVTGPQLAKIASMKQTGLPAVADDAIGNAVDALDPQNDNHWTSTGLPAMKAIEELVGTDKVKREDVERVRPGFVRP